MEAFCLASITFTPRLLTQGGLVWYLCRAVAGIQIATSPPTSDCTATLTNVHFDIDVTEKIHQFRRAKWEFLTFQYHLQIALSSHKNGKEKKQYLFFLVVLLYDSLSIGWLFSAWTALAQLRFPSTAGPFPETEPYLPVSDELPVIKLAARNKTTRLRGSGGGSGGLKPFNVGRETAESRAELPESKTRGSKKLRDQWLRA